MTELEKRLIAASLVAAACADGHLGPDERKRIATLLEDLRGDDLFRAAMTQPVAPDELARGLSTTEAKRAAYQLAVMVCEADGVLSPAESEYLEKLRAALGLTDAAAKGLQLEAEQWQDPGLPPALTTPTDDLERTILRYAILAGAAELLPQTAASVVVIPIQLKLVFEIGRRHGVTMAQDQIKELVTAFGIGATSQMVESLARRVLGGVARQVGGGGLLGGLLGGATGAATGTLMSFATTYALGHATEAYYVQGRTLSRGDLRRLFQRFQDDARTLYPKVEAEIREHASKLDADGLVAKVRGMGVHPS